MGNGRPLRSKGSIAAERHAGAQQAVRSSAYVALTFLRNQSDTGLIHIDQRPDLFRWIQVLQVIAPPLQGGGLEISGVAQEHKFRTPSGKNAAHFPGTFLVTNVRGGLDFATEKRSSFFQTRHRQAKTTPNT